MLRSHAPPAVSRDQELEPRALEISAIRPPPAIGSGPHPLRRALAPRSLLVQVLAVNVLLIVGTAILVTLAAGGGGDRAVIVAALVATLAGNVLLLRRRFLPLDDLVSTMERVDLGHPHGRVPARAGGSSEVARLTAAFNRMLARLEVERRQAGMAAVRAQERERQRIAQDLHDEVNQALTAVLLRLEASLQRAPDDALRDELAETKRLATQAMEELLQLARQLRPTVLDDHGLLAALRTQVRDFAEQTGVRATFNPRGAPIPLSPEQQLAIYRVTQESLSNVAQHARATAVDVELSFVGRTTLTISDDGQGFRRRRDGGLGLSGMRERALLAGGRLAIWSEDGNGTRVELTIA
jgi:two-component system sensor histidine kinase UhpB